MHFAGEDERGATGVEVALMIALVAVVVLGAVSFMGSRSDETLTAAGDGIHESSEEGEGGGGSTGGGSTGGGSSGGSGSTPTTAPGNGGTTTTAAPTTTTTTTAPPTTTTTTTTPEPVRAAPDLSDPVSDYYGDRYWTTTTDVTLAGDDGEPVEGATVTVTVRRRKVDRYGNVTWSTETVEATTGADGSVDLDLGPYKRTGSNRITECEITIADVQMPDDAEWDGSTPTVTATPP